MPDQAPGDEAREFAGAFRAFPALTTVTGAHLARALDDLLDAAQAVTRTLLGVGVDPAHLPPGGALTPGPGRAGPMMYARRAKMVRRFGPYSG